MARRSEHSRDEIREMVLKAAEMIVAEEGFSGLKVRKIALKIGYTVGSIYMVFENMDDLIMHLKVRVLDDIEASMDQSETEKNDPERAIVELARTYLNFAGNQFNRWSMVFEHSLSKDQDLPDWYRSRVDNVFIRVENLLGQLRPDYPAVEVKRAARALWGGIHGVCILSLTGAMDVAGISNVGDSVVLLTENFIRGWCSPE